MSKARSPREVCSTTIGTIGLIGAAVYRSAPAGHPASAGPGVATVRPEGEEARIRVASATVATLAS